MSRANPIEARVRDAMNAAMAAVVESSDAVVIIDSPPGAGKTWFCEHVIALAIGELGMRVCYVAPKVDQGADMARRLLQSRARFPIDVLAGKTRSAPDDLNGRVTWTSDASAVGGLGHLLITNPQKLTASRGAFVSSSFDLLLIDEAYQVSARDFLPIANLAPRIAMVGDPGQLAPTTTIETGEFENDGSRMHWAAPLEVLRNRPDTPVHQLPASRRLVADTVSIVQPSFYPQLPFVSAADVAERRLSFDAAGMHDPLDAALDLLAQGNSVVALLLPGAPPSADERDPEVERVVARVCRRILERGARWQGRRSLEENDLGVADTHVLSGQATQAALQEVGLGDVSVRTPELWQGQEVPIMVIKHPLSVGSAAPGEFDLDPGRFCVMLSRHLLGCIIVGRESIGNLIEGYMHDSRPTPIGAKDKAWAGFSAHATVWRLLSEGDRIRILRA
jgi:hypothetical protein